MKAQKINNIKEPLNLRSINPIWYLLIGIITMSLSHLSYSVDVMGWISMVPFLIYLSLAKGWKSKLYFTTALIIAWSFIVLKIITQPIPVIFVFLYSIPISLFHLPGYMVWVYFKDRKYSLFLFPAVMVVMEWIQYTFTPLGSWGAAAYTQTQSISMMQFLSISGMAGLGFLVYWANISVAITLINKKWSVSTSWLPAVVILTVLVWGSYRFNINKSNGRPTITVAAVGTNSSVGGLPLPPYEENENHIKELLSRSKQASNFGAKIVVWNEAAFYLERSYENTWIDSIKLLAHENKIAIVASYVVPLTENPLTFENKYLLINSQGRIINEYFKHEPVPGEPAIKGEEPFKSFNLFGTNLGGAICYDYDFPYIAKGYSKINSDIVAVPSSDWRGIDPLHTRMAAFRAVEQGHSVLRSTRFGLSAAISPFGEMLSQQSSFDDNQKIMVAELPLKGITTIYSIIGDTLIYLCITFIFLFIVVKRK